MSVHDVNPEAIRLKERADALERGLRDIVAIDERVRSGRFVEGRLPPDREMVARAVAALNEGCA